jgi:hypothetical protein
MKSDKYRVCIIVQQGNPHAACFTEIALLLRHSLLSMNIDCDIAMNDLERTRMNIILGGNQGIPPGLVSRGRYILYQLEQLSEAEGWWSEGKVRQFENADAVWDYSLQNIAFLAARGISACHVPPGYHPALEQIRRKPDPSLDILFFGSRNQRRNEIVQQLYESGLRVQALFGVYGKDRDAYIADAKILLNVHFYSAAIFESIRVSYLLNNRCYVISEESNDCPYQGVSVPQVPYGSIVETCIAASKDPENLDQHREKMFLEFSHLYPMQSILSHVLI